MAEQLVACARQLFEGASGGDEQRAANAWLMKFQRREEAWQAALQLLEQPARNPLTHRTLAAPELVAMQILRLKTQHEWTRISAQQQQAVRQTLLKLLQMTCVSDSGLSAVSFRIACVTLADIVVKSCKSWPGWKRDVQVLVDAAIAAQRQQKAADVLAEILGAIPMQILACERLCGPEEIHELLATFQSEGEEAMTAVQMILSSIPDERSSALRCLEGWIIGCIPTHEAFGLNAAHLFSRGLIDELLNIVIGGSEEQSLLAAEIAADSFVYSVSTLAPENMISAVLRAGHRLIEMMPIFQPDVQSPPGQIVTREQQTTACRGISRITCSLAMNHASALFSNDLQVSFESCTQEQQQKQSRFPKDFLELLLACSSYNVIDVVQPTLEIWFFFLEDNSSQNEVSWQLLDSAGQEHVVSVLSRLVNALIETCKFPQWFIERHQLVSDEPEIESIADVRREIADTMLSLFAKWPGGPGKPDGDYASCVKGLSQLLSESKDVAAIDALLFLLSYMVELFDVVSSDSESEDDPESFQAPASSGMDILLGVLDCAPNLPMHPLVINGITRYLRSLSVSIALPASVHLRTSVLICYGLQFTASFSVAVQSLLQSSSSITKYTTVEERAPLLQALLQCCINPQVKTTQESEGDLLEVTFRVASGASDAEFGALCSSILSNLTVRVQSTKPAEASSGVYLLGRALSGVQDQKHGAALVDQLWSLICVALLQHKAADACRCAGVQFFLNVIPHLQEESAHPIEAQMLDVCMWWYGENIAPEILTCCSRIISRHRGESSFLTSVDQVFERLLACFRIKLHDAAVGSCAEKMQMEDFLARHNEADKMISEVEQFMKLAGEVLSSFPQVLLQNRPNGEPTLYWTCLDLATRLIKVDHQMQEMCDAACDFLLGAMRCQPEPLLERINVLATEIVRDVLGFLGEKRVHYRVRNVWDFLFQCLHAPQMPVQIRGGFLSAVSTVVLEEGALREILPVDVYQQMPGELRMRRQRHRFRQYFTQLVHAAEAVSA